MFRGVHSAVCHGAVFPRACAVHRGVGFLGQWASPLSLSPQRIKIPRAGAPDELRSFDFYLSSVGKDNPQGSFDCVHQFVSSSGASQLASLGTVQDKITVCATSDSYQTTRERMTQAEEEKSSRSTKVIKPGGPFVGKSPLCLLSKRVQIRKPAPGAPDPAPERKRSTPINPATTIRKSSTSSPVALRPYRDRVIHLLALKPYKKPEILARLQREGVNQKDKNSLGLTLQQVANLNPRDNSYTLKEHMYREVQKDWPGYSPEDRQQLELLLARKAGGGQAEASSCSPPKEPGAGSPPQLVQQVFPALCKRQHPEEGWTVEGRVKRSSSGGEPRPDATHFGSGAFFSVSAPGQGGRKGMDTGKAVNRILRDTNGLLSWGECEEGGFPAWYEHFAESSECSWWFCEGPAWSLCVCVEQGRRPVQASLRCSSSELPAGAQLPELTVVGIDLHPLMSRPLDQLVCLCAADMSPLASLFAETAPGREREKDKDKEREREKDKEREREKDREGKQKAEHTEERSRKKRPEAEEDRGPRTERSPRPDKEGTKAGCPQSTDLSSAPETPDYLIKYTAVQSPDQRQSYKDDFNAEYEEYRALHARVESVTRRFARLDAQRRRLPPGTKEYQVIHEEVLQEYKRMKESSPNYHEEKCRCEYLHNKLAHIKRLIGEFDQARAQPWHSSC
ncbi:ELL2 factor, partial [Atractosteus spatula]|nr:ELL2 factor [Atractosteus spatula]